MQPNKRLNSAVADGSTRHSTTSLDDRAQGPEAKTADPCALVLFGATGDLACRLVVPALYHLSRKGLLPDGFALIGVARAANTVDSWREQLLAGLKRSAGSESIDRAAWTRLTDRMSYVRGDLTEPQVHLSLLQVLDDAAAHGTQGNAIFYLAVADQLFGAAIEQLGKANLTEEAPLEEGKRRYWRRVVIEKPFGHSLDSARALNCILAANLHEGQIFRIDHFLGKEAVQNIMVLRFANGMFEPLWSHDHIDHVQITAAETLGVEGRGPFYEATGALRDMVPNHALSLISLVAMEPPAGFGGVDILKKKSEVFAAIAAVHPSHAVRGQYQAGAVSGGPEVAYLNEPGVAPNSKIETYVALKFEIDTWRWAGVPFYFRTGKHLSARTTQIAICFKPSAYATFSHPKVEGCQPNWLLLDIDPNESITMEFGAKRSGVDMELAPVSMQFRYDDWFPKEANVGYETLIYDVMIGDQTLFMNAEMVEQGWRVVQDVLDAWDTDKDAPAPYRSGEQGPQSANALIALNGQRAWRPIKAAE
jgi:glucose-6-phosphate 1-dehydrogenase